MISVGLLPKPPCTNQQVVIFLPVAVTQNLVCKIYENYSFVNNMIQFLFAGHLVSFAYPGLAAEIPDNPTRTAHAHFTSLLRSRMCLSLTITLSPALLLSPALTLS